MATKKVSAKKTAAKQPTGATKKTTSKSVASTAAKLLNDKTASKEVKAVAASALAQTADTPEAEVFVDEEAEAALRWTKDDKKLEPFVDKGFLPDRVNTRAAIQGVSPIEIARQRAEEWNEPVEQRIEEAEKL